MPNLCTNWNDMDSLLRQSKDEFSKKCRRISIKNMPQGISNQDILDLLKPYYYQQIHIDKTSQSCKAVLLNGEAAMRCINDLHMKPYNGVNMNVSLASCDFMLCITQLPLMYTLEQFQTLITPFGTAERCFLVHSEISGESKGYGCVEFTSKESSIKAKNQLNGKKIGVQVLQVHWLDSIPGEYSGLHSKCLYVENLPYNFKDNSLLTSKFSVNSIPQFCKLASSSKDDFAVVEFLNHVEAEDCWRMCNGVNIGGNAIRVSFCVPGPCGLVILNSLRASRDLKRNNPSGGLLPTPVQQITDNSLHQRVQLMQQKINQSKGLLPHFDQSNLPLNNVDGSMSNAANHSDPEVQRLLKALQVRLLHVPPDNECHMIKNISNQLRQISSSNEGLHNLNHNSSLDTKPLGSVQNTNHLLPLRSNRGRSASYDSGVHTVDEDVFSSNNSSQEDVQQSNDIADSSSYPSQMFPPYFQPSQQQQQQQYGGWSSGDSNNIKRSWKSMQPLTYDNVLYCKREELQRSDSADSAYGGSQESATSLSEGYHYGNQLSEWPTKSKSFNGQHLYKQNTTPHYNSSHVNQPVNGEAEHPPIIPTTNSYQPSIGRFQSHVANGIKEFHPGVAYQNQTIGIEKKMNQLKHHPKSHFDLYRREQTSFEPMQKSLLPRPEFLEVGSTTATTQPQRTTNGVDHLPIFTSFLPNKFQANKHVAMEAVAKTEIVTTPSRPVKSKFCADVMTTPRIFSRNYNLREIGADSPTQLQLLGSSLMEGLFGDSPRSTAGSISLSSSLGTSCEAGRLIHALNLFSPSEIISSPHTPLAFKKLSLENVLPSPEPSPEAGAYVGQHSQGLGGHYAESPLASILLHKRRKSNEL